MDIERCTHFWKVQGEPQHRWWDGHALAKCIHCFARTAVEYKAASGIGPCDHSVGLFLGAPHFVGETPLEKEGPELTEPGKSDNTCEGCGVSVPPPHIICDACFAKPAPVP